LPARKVRNLSNCALPLAAAGCGSSRGRQGKTGEDRDLLAPVYNWFTEDFDTKDLKDAKALLEQLT